MDEILYLEPDEEITSVIDKIKNSNAQRLSLVVPRDATLLQSVVNLRILLKEASSLSKEIVLITSDKIGRNLAAKVGLTVYESVKNQQPIYQPPPPVPTREEIIEINDAQNVPQQEIRPKGVQVHHFQEKTIWQKPKIKTPTPTPWQPPKTREFDWKKSHKIIWPLLALVLLLILIGAFLIFPKVEVRLKVKAENFQQNIDVQIAGNIESSDTSKKIFAGKLIDLNQEKEEKFPTTGKKNLGGKASGTLSLYNYWDSASQDLGASTKFSSSAKTFVAKSSVSIPGTSIKGGNIVPGTATVEIEAENPGEQYNVKAGRFTIVGLSADQQEKIYGQSAKDLSGGFSKEVQVVSQADFDQAKNKLTQELTEGLKKDLRDQTAGMVVIEDGWQIDTAEETVSAKVDSEAQDFTLKIKLRLREIVYEKNNFEKFILTTLEAQLSQDKMLSLGPNDVISPKVKEKKYDQNLLDLNVMASAKISSKIDTQGVKDHLLGKNRKEAESYLNNLEGIVGSNLRFFPSWWPVKRLPNLQKNVTVSLDYLDPEASPSPSPSPTSPTLTSSPSPEVSP